MKKPVEILHRLVVQHHVVGYLLAWCEQVYGNPVYLSKSCMCERYALRGCPAGWIDLAIDVRAYCEPDSRQAIVLEIGRKDGRYDGATRTRLTLRIMPRHIASEQQIPAGDLCVGENGDSVQLVATATEPEIEQVWSATYWRLRVALNARSPRDIIMWHWSRYYQHLDQATAESVAAEWQYGEYAASESHWTLAEANRSASRALYRASRQEGWRKLTLRERQKLGLPACSPQWHRSDAVASLAGTPTGCGDYTLVSAAGIRRRYPRED